MQDEIDKLVREVHDWAQMLSQSLTLGRHAVFTFPGLRVVLEMTGTGPHLFIDESAYEL